MTKKETLDFVKQLMLKSEALHLATVDSEGNPQVRALVNLRNPDNYPKLTSFFKDYPRPFEVFIVTDSISEKSAEIHTHPRVAVYFSIPILFYGVSLSGIMEPVTDSVIKETLWHDEWKIYFPKGWEDPSYEVFSMNPDRMKGWNNTSMFEFPMGENPS